MTTANQAFVEAMHWGVAVAAVPTAIGAIVAFVFLPARAAADDQDGQRGEYLEEHAADEDIDEIRSELGRA